MVITIKTLISTFSAVNASLLALSKEKFEIAQDDKLPKHFLSQFWNKPIRLMVTCIATLILVNILEIESISIAGSISLLIIFAVVNFVAFKLSKNIDGNRYVSMSAFVLCLIVILALIIEQFKIMNLANLQLAEL